MPTFDLRCCLFDLLFPCPSCVFILFVFLTCSCPTLFRVCHLLICCIICFLCVLFCVHFMPVVLLCIYLCFLLFCVSVFTCSFTVFGNVSHGLSYFVLESISFLLSSQSFSSLPFLCLHSCSFSLLCAAFLVDCESFFFFLMGLSVLSKKFECFYCPFLLQLFRKCPRAASSNCYSYVSILVVQIFLLVSACAFELNSTRGTAPPSVAACSTAAGLSSSVPDSSVSPSWVWLPRITRLACEPCRAPCRLLWISTSYTWATKLAASRPTRAGPS